MEHIKPLQVRVDLRVRIMKGYSTLPIVLDIDPHHQTQFSVTLSLSLSRECSWCIFSLTNKVIDNKNKSKRSNKTDKNL